MARVKRPGYEHAPERLQQYVIKRDGQEVGTLRWVRKWGRGDGCWEGTQRDPSHGMPVSVDHPNKLRVLEWFKTGRVP